MAARAPKANVQPTVLYWLRQTSGLSIEQTAKKVNTKPQRILAWEKGEAQPSMPQLRNLARAFKRPISHFFLPQPIEEPSIPHDFRRLPDAGFHQYSPELLHEIRLAYRRRLFALDLTSDIGTPVTPLTAFGSATSDSSPEDTATEIRSLLGVNADVQRTWRESRMAYGAWRKRIESLGVLVFQVTTVDLQQMLGFSLAYTDLPVIAINRKLSPNGRTFTMLHEFVHLLLGQSGVCDLDEKLPHNQRDQRIEVFCNHVAGAALVPKNELLAHTLVVSKSRQAHDWNDDTIQTIAKDFGASEEVVVRRLLICGRTSQDFYSRKRAQYRARLLARDDERRDVKDFKRNMPQEVASNLSSFARLVLNGYHSDVLSLAETSRHLGVRAEKVAAVQNLVVR